MTIYLQSMTLTLYKSRFIIPMSCSDEFAVRSCLLFVLQR